MAAAVTSWDILEENVAEHFARYPVSTPSPSTNWENSPERLAIAGRIERIIEESLYTNLVLFPAEVLSNVHFLEGYGLRRVADPQMSAVSLDSDQDRYHKFLFVLHTVLVCLREGKRTNKRDIYYQNAHTFRDQGELDAIIAKVVSMTGVPRSMLGVFASSKGLVAGNLLFADRNGVEFDCRVAQVQVPQDPFTGAETTARLIVVVEKDTAFQRLLQDFRFSSLMDEIILITGKGVPDVATRSFLYMLTSKLLLPSVILTDCDPYGIEIMLTYRYGSRAMALCGEALAVPSLLWLGILPSDVDRITRSGIKVDSIPFSGADRKKLKDIYRRPYIQSMTSLTEEMELMWTSGAKVEIEHVAELPDFCTTMYITDKLNNMNLI